jgi:thiamine pyrophosphate-dependent acetolactate synthase large subunit-like protein
VDVGNNTYSFVRYFECDRHAVLMFGYLGSIGFSFPTAMGAWTATQEDDPCFKGRQVISIFGDGGLILNVIKDELPQQRETSLGAFLAGMSGYAALLVMVAH